MNKKLPPRFKGKPVPNPGWDGYGGSVSRNSFQTIQPEPPAPLLPFIPRDMQLYIDTANKKKERKKMRVTKRADRTDSYADDSDEPPEIDDVCFDLPGRYKGTEHPVIQAAIRNHNSLLQFIKKYNFDDTARPNYFAKHHKISWEAFSKQHPKRARQLDLLTGVDATDIEELNEYFMARYGSFIMSRNNIWCNKITVTMTRNFYDDLIFFIYREIYRRDV